MTKYTKITVTSNGSTGKIPTKSKIVNISSAPHAEVARTISAQASAGLDFNFVDLHGSTCYIHSIGTTKYPTKQTRVLFVVDEDDRNADIKIRNIIRRSKYNMVGKMIYNIEKSKHKITKMNGLKGRYINQHHTMEIIKQLQARQFNPEHVENVVEAVIVRTYDDCAGSIAGLTVVLNKYGVPFEIENAVVNYPEGWLTTKKDVMKMAMSSGYKGLSDILPENDKFWKYKLGYSQYVDTDRGPAKMLIKKEVDKRENIVITKLKGVMKWLKGKMKKMIGIIKGLFTHSKPKPEIRLAWSTLPKVVPSTVNMFALIRSMMVEQNASRDIKKANEIIATMNLNKMLSKVGPGGNKNILQTKLTDSSSAYIAMTQSFNTTEAITVANNLAAKANRKNRLGYATISCVVTASYYALSGGAVISCIILTLMIVMFFMAKFEPEWIILLNMCISSRSLTGLIVNLLIAVIETMLSPANSTNTIRVFVYTVAQILSF